MSASIEHEIYNPFSSTPGRAKTPYDDDVVMGGGARGLVNDFQRADLADARRDPLAEATAALTKRKTDIGYARQAAENLRDSFLDNEGADLFARNPDTKKVLKLDGAYLPKMGPELDNLRAKSQQTVGFLEGAFTSKERGQPTDDAIAAAKELAKEEPRYKTMLDKWQRIQDRLKQIGDAHSSVENQIGELANQRLAQQGITFGAPAPSPPVTPGQAAPAQSQQQPAAAPERVLPTTAPNGGPTPLVLLQLHKQIKDSEAAMGMETTSDHLKEALRQKIERTNEMFFKGMALLPEGSRKRVIDMTRDPTLGEKMKNFVGRMGEGMGGTVLDAGEFTVRNALRLTGQDADAPTQLKVKEFADSMREEAAGWGHKGLAPEVVAKLREGLSGDVGQGVGSTLAFIAPTSIVGGAGKMLGLSEKVIARLMTATVAATGAASEANNFRREAEQYLQADLAAGKITKEEMNRSLGMAEFFGGAMGSTEAFTGISRMTRRIGGGPTGKSFLRKLFDVAGAAGPEGAAKWLRGAGRKAAVDVASEMFEEAVQEFGQTAGENLYASLTFDKGREILPAASSASGTAAISTLIVSSLTQALGLPAQTRRYKALGEAVNRGAEARKNGAAAPTTDRSAVDEFNAKLDRIPGGPKESAVQRPGSVVDEDETGEVPIDPELAQELRAGQNQTSGPAMTSPPASPDAESSRPMSGQPGTAAAVPQTPPASDQDGRLLKRWTFTDAGGKQHAVTGSGLKDAIDKLPAGFKPMLKTTPIQSDLVPAPAEFLGIEGEGTPKQFESYRLTKEIPGHPAGSSVSRATLEDAGYSVPALHHTPDTLEGEQINKQWTAFSGGSQSLGIPRAEMPQIKAEARGALTQFLGARGVEHVEEKILPGALKPTQAEYSQAKVDKARDFTGGDRAILISSDNHVVDGHHQWMAKLTDAPDKPMRVIRLKAPIRDLLTQIAEFPSVKAAAGATKPTSQPATSLPGQDVGASTKSQAAADERMREDLPEAKPIIDRLSELSGLAEKRHSAMAEGQVKNLTHPSDLLTPEEKEEMHRLQLRLRPKSREEAAADVRRKRAERIGVPNPAPIVERAPLASPQSFKATRADLLPRIDQAIAAAKPASAFRETAETAVREAFKFPRDYNTSQKARKEADAVIAELIDDKINQLAGNITIRSGNSSFTVPNTQEMLGRLRRRAEGNIPKNDLPGRGDSTTRSQSAIVSDFKAATSEAAKRAFMDQMTADTLQKLGLDEKYERFAGVTLTSEAAKALRDLKAGKLRNFDIEASTPIRQTDTPEFQAWFAGSKIVDLEGKPLVVYHGTSADFSAFDISRHGTRTDDGWLGRGFYFTRDQEVASIYAAGEPDYDKTERGANVIPAYLSIKNPYYTGKSTLSHAFVERLKAKGYDGVIQRFGRNGSDDFGEILAFHPEQIKSAIGNRGTFSPELADITRSNVSGPESEIDPTAPASLAFRDATSGEYSEGLVRQVREFAAVLNAERRRAGEAAISLTPRALETDDQGSRVLGGRGEHSRGGTQSAARFIRGIETALGKRVVFVQPGANVAWEALSSPGRANTILVNTNARNPVAALVGHELGHNIKAQNRDLWDRMASVIHAVAGEPSQDYRATKAAQGYDTAEKQNDEWLSDVLGQRFDEPEFWREVERVAASHNKQHAFAQLARTTWEWLSGLLRNVRRVFTREADRTYIRRIEELRRGLAEVMVDFRDQMPEGGYPDDPAGNDEDDLAGVQASTPEEPRPGWRFRGGADTERAAGLNAVRQIYERRGQKPDLETADAIIGEFGVQRAADLGLSSDGKNGMDPVLREAVLIRAMERAAEEATQKAGPERAALLRLVQRISSEHNPDLTEMGQAISMRQNFNRLDNPAGVIDQAVRETERAQDTALGGKEGAAKTLKSVKAALDEGTTAATDEAAKSIRGVLRRQAVSKSIWQRYRDRAAARLLRLVEQTAAPAPKASLQEFVDRVVAEARARFADQLPQPDRKTIPAADVLREAVTNREKYADVLESVREKFVAEHGEGSPVVDLVDLALSNLGLRPYTNRLLDRAIREAHRDMQTSAAELARQHFTETDPKAEELAARLVSEIGLQDPGAIELATSATKRAQEIVSDARRKALAALLKKHSSTKVTRQVVTAVMRAGLLNNLGAFEASELRDVVAKELKLPRLTPAQMDKLASLSDNVRTAPNEMARGRAERELLEEMRLYRGVRPVDLLTSMWYANVLSSPATHVANFGPGNIVSGLLQVGSMVATNPRQAPQAVLGYLHGLGTGWADAKSIVAKGEGLRDFGDKFGQAGRILEIADAKRDLPGWVPGKSLIDMNVGLLRYVGRLMRAADSVFFHAAADAYRNVTTSALLAADYQGPDLAKKVRDTLSVAPVVWVKAKKQAEAEGWQGTDLTLRVASLIQKHRAEAIANAVGLHADDVGAGAQLFGEQATLNQTPEGLAGVVYRGLSQVAENVRVKDVPVLKPFLMFLKIPTNLFNTSLNLTPLGALRAFNGTMLGETKSDTAEEGGRLSRRYMSEDERARLYAQSVFGTLMMAALAAAAGGGDDDDRWFDITAKGPEDYRKRQQLEATGWRPYSMKFGDRWISYKDTALLIPLALTGAYVDATRYSKTKDELLGNRLTNAAAKAPQVIFETSMLQGLAELMDAMRGESNAVRMESFLARLAVSAQPYVPGTAMLSAIDRTMFPEQREPDAPGGALTAAVPFARNLGSMRSDVLGEPVKRSPWDRFSSTETNDPLREMLRDKGVFISTPSRSTMIGNEVMDEDTFREYVRVSGQRIRSHLTPMVTSLRGASKEAVERTVERIVSHEREITKNLLRSQMRSKNVERIYNPFAVR